MDIRIYLSIGTLLPRTAPRAQKKEEKVTFKRFELLVYSTDLRTKERVDRRIHIIQNIQYIQMLSLCRATTVINASEKVSYSKL